jgi:hypothetical protein
MCAARDNDSRKAIRLYLMLVGGDDSCRPQSHSAKPLPWACEAHTIETVLNRLLIFVPVTIFLEFLSPESHALELAMKMPHSQRDRRSQNKNVRHPQEFFNGNVSDRWR